MPIKPTRPAYGAINDALCDSHEMGSACLAFHKHTRSSPRKAVRSLRETVNASLLAKRLGIPTGNLKGRG
jgi:hypothetical protein